MSAVQKTSPHFWPVIDYAIKHVTKISGNSYTEQHHFFIETKIKKRMIDLKINNPDDYLAYVRDHQKVENEYFVSQLTTHYTFFFREFLHFEYLQLNLPKIVENLREKRKKTLNILCLACSRGHEVYSVGMFFEHHLKQLGNDGIDYKIHGIDIDPESVKIAKNGVYRYSEIKMIPMKYLGDHWQKGSGDISHFVKMKKTIKDRCSFSSGSILELNKELKHKYDIIFCRNVFIYFEEPQVKKISRGILEYLTPEGVFFTGVSESLSSMDLPIDVHGPSIYGHKTEKIIEASPKISRVALVKPVEVLQPTYNLPNPIKVLCVDDSKIILSLLKKIINSKSGYEVVGTAENGIEANDFLKSNDVDMITLDIHMPKMDGITYLEKYYSKDHPPVIIVSSVSREDASQAMKGIRLGASDYIEKPSLEDFASKGDEICTKLKSAVIEKKLGHLHTGFARIDNDFKSKVMENSDRYFYAIYAQYSDRKKITHIIKELSLDKNFPPTFIFFEGSYNMLDEIVAKLKRSFTCGVEMIPTGESKFKSSTVYIGDFKESFDRIYSTLSSKTSSLMAIGHHSETAVNMINTSKVQNLLLDDVNFVEENATSALKSKAVDIGPYTSFAYQAKHFVLKDE
ncbi:MAG: response regulator [Halobacteriovoraceae bacterium]|jgi:chemotaxis protein methyltransferase CheR|nr:response regulator [Halobacteriovoraceae bacterium]